MLASRRYCASILIAIYGALAGALLGAVATIWMWGLGFLLGLPVGLVCGAFLGWQTPLRDAVVLFTACFAGLILIRCGELVFSWSAPVVMLLWVLMCGPLTYYLWRFGTPEARFRFAVAGLIATFISVALLTVIRT